MRNFFRICVVMPAAVLLVAGCSSSKASDEGSGSGGSAASSAGSAAPTGKPIKLMLIGYQPLSGDSVLGAQTAAKAISAAGGVKGRPLQIVPCNDNNDANTAAQCARNAVADPNTFGFVGNITSFGSSVDPIAEAANLPSIATAMNSQADFSSSIVFPVQGGGLLVNVGRVTMCADVLHAKKIGMVSVDIPGAATDPSLAKKMTQTLGLPDPVAVTVPLTAADVSAQVAAVSHTDCIIATMQTDLTTRFILTARQQGVTAPIVVGSTTYSPKTLKEQLGPDVKGVYLAQLTNIYSDGFKELQGATAKFSTGSADALTAGSAQAWLGVHMFAHVANGIKGGLTRQAVLDGMRHLSGYDTKGLTAVPVDYTVKATAMGGSLPNLRPSASGLWALEDQGGKPVLLNDGKSVNVFP